METFFPLTTVIEAVKNQMEQKVGFRNQEARVSAVWGMYIELTMPGVSSNRLIQGLDQQTDGKSEV